MRNAIRSVLLLVMLAGSIISSFFSNNQFNPMERRAVREAVKTFVSGYRTGDQSAMARVILTPRDFWAGDDIYTQWAAQVFGPRDTFGLATIGEMRLLESSARVTIDFAQDERPRRARLRLWRRGEAWRITRLSGDLTDEGRDLVESAAEAIQANDIKRAMGLYAQAVAKCPAVPEVLEAYSHVLSSQGQHAEAARHARLWALLSPGNPRAANGFAWMAALGGVMLDDALAAAKYALALQPEDAAIRDTLGWVHYQRGEYAAAVQELTAAAQQSVSDEEGESHAAALAHLGAALIRTGDVARARRVLERCLQQHPDSSFADEARESLRTIQRRPAAMRRAPPPVPHPSGPPTPRPPTPASRSAPRPLPTH